MLSARKPDRARENGLLVNPLGLRDLDRREGGRDGSKAQEQATLAVQKGQSSEAAGVGLRRRRGKNALAFFPRIDYIRPT
jgi:hypothetical protein